MALLQRMCSARIAQILSSLQQHILRPASPYLFTFPSTCVLPSSLYPLLSVSSFSDLY